MSIKVRLLLGLVALLLLFGATQAIFIVTSRFRSDRMQILDRTLKRQVLLASVRQGIDNMHKQVMVTSQIQGEDATMVASPESRQALQDRLKNVKSEIQQIKDLTDVSEQADVNRLAESVSKLADAWNTFYQYLGADAGTATASLITADPLAQQVLSSLIPKLEKAEQQRATQAEAEFKRVEKMTDEATWTILIVTVLMLIAGHFIMTGYLTRTVRALQEGAVLIGHGQLEHRIKIKSNDEFGQLATTFNEMSENLLGAQNSLIQANKDLEDRTSEIEEQQRLSDRLLLNILPTEVALELQTKGSVDPKYFEDVTILFTDFVGFTLSTEHLAAEDLVHILHEYFTAFDQIVEKYGLEKLKTIGDSYMCVGGMPVRNPSHPVDIVMAAFEMVQYVVNRQQQKGAEQWAVRIGVHTGPVVAGVVGIQKFAFDIWGDSVNFASRMESSGSSNRINISAATQMRIKDFFENEHRGKVFTKDKREADMYFVKGVLPALLDGSGRTPPEKFEKRYRTYFQKEMNSFPSFLVDELARLSGD